jgi:hypothetical protein
MIREYLGELIYQGKTDEVKDELRKIKNELIKTSSEFRMYADRLMQTSSEDAVQNLKRFVKFIDQNLVISDFLRNKRREAESEFIIESFKNLELLWLHEEWPNHEVTLTHQFLQYGAEKLSNRGYSRLIDKAGCANCTLQDGLKEFRFRIIEPFVCYIEVHLSNLQIDLQDDENAKSIFNWYYSNYGTHLEAIMTEMNLDQSNSSIGVGVNQAKINTKKLAGTINEVEKQNLTEAATEIRQLLEELSRTYPSHTTKQKMIVAAEAIECIESDPAWKHRAINALKQGGLAAFEKAIDNPGGAFIVEAIKGWQEAEVQ